MGPVDPHLYVLGEEGSCSLVKIATSPTERCPSRRSGSDAGWHRLVVLGRVSLPIDDLDWHELLVHERLRPYHVAGKWFDVGHLVVGGDWDGFLRAVLDRRFDRHTRAAAGSRFAGYAPSSAIQSVSMSASTSSSDRTPST